MQIEIIDIRRTSIVPVECDNSAYEAVVSQGLEDFRRMERYFLRQQIAGVTLLLIALPSFLWLGDGIGTVVLTPIAVCMIFQRQIVRLERRIGRWYWKNLQKKRKIFSGYLPGGWKGAGR